MTRHLLRLALLALLCGPLTVGHTAAQVAVRLSDRNITIRGEKYLIHKVRKGETLYAIAKAYAVSQDEIMRANSLTRDILRPKQTLLIPQHKAVAHREAEIRLPAPRTEPVTPSVPPATIPEPLRNAHIPEYQNNGGIVSTDTIAAPAIVRATENSGKLRAIDRNAPINVAILLPMQAGMHSNDKFSEYYKGILLGLNALKTEGTSVNARFLNTGASEEKVRDHIRSGALDKADLIIGPIYAEAFDPVATYAAEQGVPIVSPLGSVGAENNAYVYETPPAEESPFDRIFGMFGGQNGSQSTDANLIVIDHVEHPDTASLARIEAQLGERASSVSFTGVRTQSKAMDVLLTAALDKERDNIVYVPVNRVDALEGVLSHLSSLNMGGRYRITVIGTPRWAWIDNINLDLFYKLNAHYPASYHADRSDPAVAEFYREYMESFGDLPSPYAFRGYDVIRYFAGALKRFGSDMPDRIATGEYNPPLLQVGYDYRQQATGMGGKYKNTAWPVVNFRPDYAIQVLR